MTSQTPPLVLVDLYQVANKATRTGRPQRWRWRAVNGNNEHVMAVSSEAYTNQQDCLTAIAELFGNGSDVYLRQTEQGDQQLRLATK